MVNALENKTSIIPRSVRVDVSELDRILLDASSFSDAMRNFTKAGYVLSGADDAHDIQVWNFLPEHVHKKKDYSIVVYSFQDSKQECAGILLDGTVNPLYFRKRC